VHDATTVGRFAVCRLLLEANADCCTTIRPHDVHPLTRAVRADSVALTRLLLDHGAPPDNNVGRNIPRGMNVRQSSLILCTAPIWDAARAANHPILALLLDDGANPTGITVDDPLVPAATVCANPTCRAMLTRALVAWETPWSVDTHSALSWRAREVVTTLMLINRRHHHSTSGCSHANVATEGTRTVQCHRSTARPARVPRLPLELWLMILGSAPGNAWMCTYSARPTPQLYP
jgi:ankyrin repeat protein